MKKISIVVPCYNEEEVLEMFYKELINITNKTKNICEIIFVDDGSKDNTLRILKKLREDNKKIKIISFSRNFGKEAAIYAGLNNSVGDYVILMDSDLQHPPETILEMLTEIDKGYDMVATKRKNRNRRTYSKELLFEIILQNNEEIYAN